MQEIKNISTYKQSLKDRILETAMSLFAENGIRAVKMDDIANKLSISKRTLYEVYKDKEYLLFEGVKKYYRMRHEQMKQKALESDNVMDIILQAYRMKVDEFRVTNSMFYSDIAKYPNILRYFEEEKKKNRTQFMDFLSRGVAEGYFRDDVNFELIAHMFDALGTYIMSEQLYKRYTISDVFVNLVFVSLRGFCTSEGVKVLDGFLGGGR